MRQGARPNEVRNATSGAYRWPRRWALLAWICWVLSIALLWEQHRLSVLHPWSLVFLLLLGITFLAGLSGLMVGLWQVVRGPQRGRAAAWGLVSLMPICGWIGLGAYVHRLMGKGDSPKNIFTRIAGMAAASLMEVQAQYGYSHRMESDRLVMFYDDRIVEPRRDLDAMEEHVARMEAMTGKPLRAKIYWVRGELLGQQRMALYGLALGSSKSPTDWETADHPDRLSADRHELAHAVLHQHQPPDADPPALLVEGWAESLAGPTSQKRAEWASESRKLWREKTGAGPTESYLKDLTGAARYHRYIDGAAYSVGSAFAEFLVRKYGMERFLRLYFACQPGRFEADVQEYLGVDFNTMEHDFWEEVERLADKSTAFHPDFSLTSEAYAQEFKKDNKVHEAKYKDRLIELTGLVKDLNGPNILGQDFLVLSGAQGELWGVECVMKEKEPWKKALPGQTIKLVGKQPELAGRPGLIECQIVEVTGAGPPTLTADQLAEEYSTNPKGTTAKYNKKYLILTGEIARIDFNKAQAPSITLKTTNKVPRVFCNFTAFARERTSFLKPGQKIKILGEYRLNLGEEEVGLLGCLLLEASP